jgi:O-antigen/teichoic acid export membrane protein
MKKLLNFFKTLINNDYLFSIIAKIAGVAISVVLSVMLARYFGKELRGVIAVIENDVSIYATLLGLGVYQAYPYFKKKEPEIFGKYINNISSMFFCLELLAIIISGVMIALNINVFLAIAITLMPITVYVKQLNYVVLVEWPKRRNIGSIFISISEIIAIAVLWIITDAGTAQAIIYCYVIHILNLTISFVNLKVNPLKIRFDLTRIVEFIKFGFIPMLVYLCMTINYQVDIQMMKLMGTVAYSDIGVYSLGVGLAQKIWLIPDAVKDILLSKLVKGKGETEVAKVLRINLALCFIALILLVLVGRPLMDFMYGPDYKDAYPIMVIMLTGVIGMIFYKMIYSYNIAHGKRVINLIFLGTAAIINIIGNLILIPMMGMFGAAIVSVASYCACGLCFLIYFHKVSGISIYKLVIIQKEDFKMMKNFLKGATK